MNDETRAVIKRAARVGIAAAVGVIITHIKNDPKWMILVPLISALGKFLRTKFGLQYVPF